jgi:Calcineurin-like phosphoesterase
MDLSLYSPTYVGVLGDIHANTRWTLSAVMGISVRLDMLDEPHPRFLLQAGDFGAWPDRSGMNFLQQTSLALSAKGAVMAFAPGNHENHEYIKSWEHESPPGCPNIYVLPKGRRWVWHDRTWLALGGAVSPDKAVRKPQQDWFPEETISYLEAEEACKAGETDVMLTHDAPTGVTVQYMNPPPRYWAQSDLDRSEAHRELLRSIVEEVRPSYLIHGHYHQGFPQWREFIFHYGKIQVATLDMDGTEGNWGILNVKTMKWI